MPFITPLVLESIPDERWRVHAPLVYVRPDGERIEVPEGYETDLASVPRVFWRLFPRDGEYRDAAVLHDYLCGPEGSQDFTWSEAATVFDEAMFDLGVPTWKRWLITNAVRLNGYNPFRRRHK